MWLLETTELKLYSHPGLPPPYAILSHRWGSDEVRFEEVNSQTYRADSAGWTKIVDACSIAKTRNRKWLWADTCCIDKRSSAELSQAINSMFAWYSNAVECYALLDVPEPESLNETGTRDYTLFRANEWFRRGWTLQELLAPQQVLFYGTANGTRPYINTREGLATHIADVTCTGIDVKHLRGAASIREASVAQRMSWAANRITTEPEDRAYCLLGIFDVNIPLLYGEGMTAFTRLQLAIIAQSDDDSIFAWGFGRSAMGHANGMLAPSAKEFEHSGDFYNGPSQGLPTPDANMNTVVHTSRMSVGATILSCFVGDYEWSHDTVRLGCFYQPKNMPRRAVLVEMERRDGKFYRTRLITRGTTGWNWPGNAIQEMSRTPKRTSISSRPHHAIAGEGAGRLKSTRISDVATTIPLIRFWSGVGLVVIILLARISGHDSCSAGANTCDAAILGGILLFALRDIAANKVQFWVLLFLLFVSSGILRFDADGPQQSP